MRKTRQDPIDNKENTRSEKKALRRIAKEQALDPATLEELGGAVAAAIPKKQVESTGPARTIYIYIYIYIHMCVYLYMRSSATHLDPQFAGGALDAGYSWARLASGLHALISLVTCLSSEGQLMARCGAGRRLLPLRH